MKKTLCILILALMISTGAYAAVEPVITVNGIRGTVNLIGINGAVNPAVTVNIRVSPGEKEGADADCWLVGNAFGRWYYYTPDAQWTDIGETLDVAKLRPVYQGKLFTLPQTDILYIPQPAAGIYTLYFGIDLNMNGKLDADSLVFEAVSVVVSESGKRSDFITAGWSAGLDKMLSFEDPTSQPAPKYPHDEKITDFVPLANGYGVQLTVVQLSANEGRYSLRTVPLSYPEKSNAVSETSLGVSSYPGVIANGNLIYLISNESEYRTDYAGGKCRIQVMDFSEPESPLTRGSIDIVGNYYAPIQGGKSYHNEGHILQMNGSTLILTYRPGYYGSMKNYDAGKDLFASPPKSGESPKPQGGVKIVDFSDADHPKLLSELSIDIGGNSDYALGSEGYFLNGKLLYFSYKNIIEADLNKRPQSKYYLGRIDLSNTSEPLRLASINIPGGCIGMDSSGKYAFTLGAEWRNDTDWYLSYTFNSVRLDNDKAFLADHLTLRNSAVSAVVSEGFAYLSIEGITIVDLSNPEKLKVYENSFPVTDTWLSILDVKNRKIFVSTSDGMSCYDASDPAKLLLNESVEHYGNKIAYSGNTAYLPMGYYGTWVKNLNN